MDISILFLAAALLPILAGCDSGEANQDAPAATVTVTPMVTPNSTSAEREAIPLPRPTGDRQIGVRLSEYQIEMTKETVPAGEIEFQIVNAGKDMHYLMVNSAEVYSISRHLQPGDTTVMRVQLEPGEYDYLCGIRDEFHHYNEGMRGHIVVR